MVNPRLQPGGSHPPQKGRRRRPMWMEAQHGGISEPLGNHSGTSNKNFAKFEFYAYFCISFLEYAES